jgi:hypothetical protein
MRGFHYYFTLSSISFNKRCIKKKPDLSTQNITASRKSKFPSMKGGHHRPEAKFKEDTNLDLFLLLGDLPIHILRTLR